MKYNKIGNSGIQISRVSLGTMYIPEQANWTQKLKLFAAAHERGINYFDTADGYANGEAESFLGELLKQIPRDQVLIGSKCFFPRGTSPLQSGLSRKNCIHAVENTLRKLNSDYLDFFFLHRYDYDTPLEETIETIRILINSGKIRYWGFSAFTTFQICEAYYTARQMNVPIPVAAQYAYNLFNRSIEMETAEALSRLNIGVMGYYPLAQGVLTGKYNRESDELSRATQAEFRKGMWDLSDEKMGKVSELMNFSANHSFSVTELAMAWVLRSSQISTALTNVNTEKQLDELIKIAESQPLDPAILSTIEQIMKNKPVNPYTGKTY
jgi:aryl-alcohol dehydrogenase-like predicted oxidoreductase